MLKAVATPMQAEYNSLSCVGFGRDGFPEAYNLWKQSYVKYSKISDQF